MNARAAFLADGPSDEPLGQHVARMARRHNCDLDVSTPDLRRLDPPPGHRVAERLDALLAIDDGFDLIIVHRDAEADSIENRCNEVRDGVREIHADLAYLPVVPVRMTEAWLLVDENAIRRIAGKPSGTAELGLPHARAVESIPDPKALLKQALETAAGVSGRRLRRFKRDFPAQRRRLIEQLDHSGPVTSLESWKRLEDEVRTAVAAL